MSNPNQNAKPDLSVILQTLASVGNIGQPASIPLPLPTAAGSISSELPRPTRSGYLDMTAIGASNSGFLSQVFGGNARGSGAVDNGHDTNRHSGRATMHADSRSRSPPRRDAHYGSNHNPYIDQRRDDTRGRANIRNRSASPSGRGSAQGSQNYKRNRSPTVPEAITTEVIEIDSQSVGLVIGKNGENLKRVEGDSGARVQFVSDTGGLQRQCKITGNSNQRREAMLHIRRIIEQNPRAPPAVRAPTIGLPATDQLPALREGEKSSQITVPDRTVGLIIGRGGETIRDIQAKSGCHVNIVHENKSINGLRPVNLIGTEEATQFATNLIKDIVASDSRTAATQAQALPDYGQQTKYTPYNAGGAYNTTGDGKINDTLTIPSEAVGMVIGKGGEAIKDIQNSSGCKVNVDPAEGADINRIIRLIGTRSAIETAKKLIWEKVETVRAKQGGFRTETAQYGDQYAQYQPTTYGLPVAATPVAAAQTTPTPSGENLDVLYAAYGGYANALALWQAAHAVNGGQGPTSGT